MHLSSWPLLRLLFQFNGILPHSDGCCSQSGNSYAYSRAPIPHKARAIHQGIKKPAGFKEPSRPQPFQLPYQPLFLGLIIRTIGVILFLVVLLLAVFLCIRIAVAVLLVTAIPVIVPIAIAVGVVVAIVAGAAHRTSVVTIPTGPLFNTHVAAIALTLTDAHFVAVPFAAFIANTRRRFHHALGAIRATHVAVVSVAVIVFGLCRFAAAAT